jgi:hypothetical protein
MEDVVLLYASNRRLEGWGSLDVGGPVELLIWRSVSSLEAAPMWVSPTQQFSCVDRKKFFCINLNRTDKWSKCLYLMFYS